MLSQLIKLLAIFLLFAVIMVVIVKDKKIKFGWMVLGILLPVTAYLLCEFFESVVLFAFLYRGNIMQAAIWDTVEWTICSAVCVIAGLIIFKTVTKGKNSLITVFKNEYKKWNIVILALITLGAMVIIIEGIDYIMHEKEYEKMLMDLYMSSSFFNLITTEIMPGNMKLFSVLKDISGVAMLAGFMLPSVIMVRKSEIKNHNSF